MADNMKLVLQMMLDESAKAKTIKGVKEIGQAIEDDSAILAQYSEDMLAQQTKMQAKKAEEEAKADKASGMTYRQRLKAAEAVTAKRFQEEEKALLEKRAAYMLKKNTEEMAISSKIAQDDEMRLREQKARIAEEMKVRKKAADERAESSKVLLSQFNKEWSEEAKARTEERKADQERKAENKERMLLASKELAFQKASAKELSAINRQRARDFREIELIRRKSEMLGRAGQSLVVAGTAATGGLFAMAQREAMRKKDSGEPIDETTKKWLEANKRIELSTRRIAQVAQKTILPYLEKASALAERASKYIEKNPQVAKTVLAAGAIAVTLGSMLLLASKGMRLVADLKYLASNAQFDLATRRHEKSIHEFALAVAAQKKGSVIPSIAGKGGLASLAGGTAGLSIAGTVATVLAVIAGGTAVGAFIYDLMAKKFGLTRLNVIATGGANVAGKGLEKIAVSQGMDPKEAERKTMVFTYLVGRLTGAIKEGEPAWQSVVDGSKKATAALDDLGDSEENLAKEAEGWKVFRDLEQANIEAERAFNYERTKILEDTNKSLAEANRKFAVNATNIKKNLTDTIAKLSADYQKDAAQSEVAYQAERASIVQQGNEAIKQLEVDNQEQLRKLAEDHASRQYDLIASRDALGLIKENENYENEKDEIERTKQKAVAERRKDTAMQLRELATSHAQERAEKLQAYNQAIVDARTQAQQQLAENALAKQEELRQIKEQRAQALKELAYSYNEERRQRIQNAYNQIKDIGGALGAERAMKMQYYGMMLTDVNTFMSKFRGSLALSKAQGSTGGLPQFAAGGYVPGGPIGSHKGEFMMNKETTQFMENLVGGRLTQANIKKGGRGTSIVWNDHRSFSGEYTPAMKKAVENDTIQLIEDVLRS